MGRIGAAFDRMSKREKVMVGSLLGTLAFFVVGGAYLYLSSEVSDLETQIADHRETLEQVQRLAPKYLAAKDKAEHLKNLAEKNADTNLKLAINEIAKGVSFREHDPRTGEKLGLKTLADVLQYEQDKSDFIGPKKKRERTRGRQERIGYWQRLQEVRLTEQVPFDAIFEFLEKVETADKMLFVTKVEMKRDQRNPMLAYRSASVTVSTYFYKGKEEQ